MYKYIDTNKEHLHTFNDKPLIGTSSVSNVLAKPLTWWAAGLACEKMGWSNSKIKIGNKYQQVPIEERIEKARPIFNEVMNYGHMQVGGADDGIVAYLERLDEAYKAHSVRLDEAASDGTDLHAEIERFVLAHMDGTVNKEAFDIKIEPFITWTQKRVKRFLWSEMNCYSERLWVGGISDIGYEDVDGNYGIVDIKSSKEAYLSQFWQCAGYDILISENGGYTEYGEKIFELDKPINHYVIFPFGMKEPEPQYYYDIEGGRAAFEAELFLYKKLNN